MIDFAKLAAPFPPSRVSWRVGATNKEKTKGLALAYIDARDVMERLDEVCGPAGWQCTYPHANGKTVCSIGIKIGGGALAAGGGMLAGEWVWKSDGAGDTDVEAEKGALSDAFKRAGVRWGIGRYLYDTASPWVAIEPAGKSYKIADHEVARLMKVLGGQAAAMKPDPEPEGPTESEKRIFATMTSAIAMAKTLPDLKIWWAEPENQRAFRMLPADMQKQVEEAKEQRKAELTTKVAE